MLPERPASLKEALDLGISLFAGEAEGRFDEVLRDAAAGKLKPIYNYLNDLPGLKGATLPYLPRERIGRTLGMISSFDAGRGCPFLCSFCTIINVQGRKSRYRTADDIEQLVRSNQANGVRYFFITDDNLARNRNWESIFDRLIELRKEGLNSRFVIQVDTSCHKIPRFIEKAAAAGVKRVFIGLENIDPDNLAAAKKKQNHIADYREMLLAWRKQRCITYCGYIIGFPNDTPESLVRGSRSSSASCRSTSSNSPILTPLPGSEDHAKAVAAGVDIDPDLNKFDLEHVTTDHPRMRRDEWQEAYRLAWRTYYTEEHIKTVIRRAVAGGPRPTRSPICSPGSGRASISTISIRSNPALSAAGFVATAGPACRSRTRWSSIRAISAASSSPIQDSGHVRQGAPDGAALEREPNAKAYTDAALRTSDDYDSLEMFQLSDSARKVAEKAKRIEEHKHAAPASQAEPAKAEPAE